MRNRRNKQNSSSRFKGVRRKELNGKVTWRAEIASGQDRIMLGVLPDESHAALVYDAAAYLLFENAALYNMPDLCPEPEALEVAQAAIARFRRARRERLQVRQNEHPQGAGSAPAHEELRYRCCFPEWAAEQRDYGQTARS